MKKLLLLLITFSYCLSTYSMEDDSSQDRAYTSSHAETKNSYHTQLMIKAINQAPLQIKEIVNNIKTHNNIRKILLFGQTGTGKSLFVAALAHQLGWELINEPADWFLMTDPVAMSAKLNTLFQEIAHRCQDQKIIFLMKEIDYLAQQDLYDINSPHDKTVLLIEKIKELEHNPNFIFIGTSSNVEQVSKKFKEEFIDTTVEFTNPDREQRKHLFKFHFTQQGFSVDETVDEAFCDFLADNTQDISRRDIESILYSTLECYYRQNQSTEKTQLSCQHITEGLVKFYTKHAAALLRKQY